MPKDIIDSIYNAREIEIANTVEIQFTLAYHGHISKDESDNMSPYELSLWYDYLKKQKALEAEKIKEQDK